MSKPMPWIKQYPNMLHDARLAKLNDRQQLRYFQLYLLAGHLNADGAFLQDGKELTSAEIAFMLHVRDAAQLDKDIKALKGSRLIKVNGHGPFIAGFREEQINWVEKQQAERERKKKSRAGHASVTRDKSVTPAGVPLLEQEQEQDKNLVVVVKSALEKYEKEIGKLTDHTRNEFKDLYKRSPVNLCKAINITIEQDKHTFAYFRGVYRNLQKGTAKPEAAAPRKGPQPRKGLDNGQVKL